MGVFKMNKKGLEFKSAFFALVVAGMFILVMGIMVNSWNDAYDSRLVYDLGDDFNTMDSVSDIASVQQGQISPDDPNPGTDFEASTFRGVYGIISNIYAPFRVVYSMIDSISERFGIPIWFGQGIVTIIIISITFTLVAIIFRLARGTS